MESAFADCRQAVNRALRAFENDLTRAFRFGSLGADGAPREVLATMLTRRLRQYVQIDWDVGYPHGSESDHKDGLVHLGLQLEAPQIKETIAFLENRPVYNTPTVSGGDMVPRYLGGDAERHRLGGYKMNDILEAPHLLELATSEAALNTAWKLLGPCPPVITLMSVWWAFPQADQESPYLGQNFHRDADGLSNCALFTYLTDVDDACGPHNYIRGSRSRERLAEALAGKLPILIEAGAKKGEQIDSVEYFFQDHADGLNDIYTQYLADQIERLTLPAGHAFVTDTFGIHRGEPPKSKRRLIFVVRYGISENVNTDHLKAQHFTPPPWHRFAGRLSSDFKRRYAMQHLTV